MTCVSFDVESDGVCSGNDGVVVLVETFGNSIFDSGKVGEICDDSCNKSRVRHLMIYMMELMEVTQSLITMSYLITHSVVVTEVM